MILKSINNIIKYDNSQVLNLMESPAPDQNNNLFEDYMNFIDAVDVIYETQDPKTGFIPVFTTSFDSVSNRIVPDKYSTLHYLVPGRSYYIKIKDNTLLPVRIPMPLSLKDFILDEELTTQESCVNKCCPSLQITTKTIALGSSTNSFNISAQITNARSNEKYYYEFEPIFSNWPAEISPISGEILIPATKNNAPATGNIRSVFSYAKNLFDDIDSIPYTINKNINSSYYTNNIFTTLKLKLFDDNCLVYDDIINIFCRSCVDAYACPTIQLSSNGTDVNRYVSVNVFNLQPNTEYFYQFGTDSSNCPANITPISGLITNDRNTTSGTVYGIFKFCDTAGSSDCNLQSTNPLTDPVLVKKIFHNLSFVLRPNTTGVCENTKETIELVCNNCFAPFNTNISFSLPPLSEGGSSVRDRLYYPYPLLGNISYSHFNGTTYRPEIEYVINNGEAVVNPGSSGLLVPCCEKSIPLRLQITQAISGDNYSFDIYSYPNIDITPSTGTISFSNGSGEFSVLANPRGQSSSSIYAILTHEKSNQQASASTIVSCVSTGVYEAAAEAASRHPSGWFVHPYEE